MLVSVVLLNFDYPVRGSDGALYWARACGAERADGLWEGWIEFWTVDGGPILSTDRETTQPNRVDTEYWATGLEPVYLDGALERALSRAATGESSA